MDFSKVASTNSLLGKLVQEREMRETRQEEPPSYDDEPRTVESADYLEDDYAIPILQEEEIDSAASDQDESPDNYGYEQVPEEAYPIDINDTEGHE